MATSDAQGDRIRIRRRRRWNRRARILAPFAALPLLLATLLLLVDTVQYRPEVPDKKPMDYSSDREFLNEWSSYSTAAYAAKDPITDFELEEGIPFVLDLNLDLQRLQAQTLRRSTAPYAPRR